MQHKLQQTCRNFSDITLDIPVHTESTQVEHCDAYRRFLEEGHQLTQELTKRGVSQWKFTHHELKGRKKHNTGLFPFSVYHY